MFLLTTCGPLIPLMEQLTFPQAMALSACPLASCVMPRRQNILMEIMGWSHRTATSAKFLQELIPR
eukprot:1157900-Pelagomonas_calceolata.AAC.6